MSLEEAVHMRLAIEGEGIGLETALSLGVAGVPLNSEQIDAMGAAAVLYPLTTSGLGVAQIGAYSFNPLHPDTSVVAESTAMVSRMIHASTLLGKPAIVLSCGNYNPNAYSAIDRRNRSDQALDCYAEALVPLLVEAEAAGVRLAIEPYVKGVIYDADSFAALASRVGSPALCCNFDPTSLYDLADLMDPTNRISETCEKLAGRIGVVHLKEIALADGFHIHSGLVPLGEGPTDWAAVMRSLPAMGCTEAWCLIEHVTSIDEARRSIALVRCLAAASGIEFVQGIGLHC
jgi:sugar phosphate isomerase/epimerase